MCAFLGQWLADGSLEIGQEPDQERQGNEDR
jgi:hypothetical protein